MGKTALIMKHEFLEVVKRKGFVVLTLLFPMIALIALGIYQIVQNTDTIPETTTIGYVDEAGGYNEFTTQPGGITFVTYDTRQAATAALLAHDIDEYFIIPEDYVSRGTVLRYTVKKEIELPGEIYRAMKSFLLGNLLEGRTSPEVAERAQQPLYLATTRLEETGEVATDQGGFGAFFLPLIFGFLLIMAIGSSSGYMLQGLGEEKENRIMEILLSSVSTRQLLTGKVLGLGAAGLVQIIIWLLSAVFLAQLASTTVGGEFSNIQIPNNFVLLGIVYFVLGYLLFAVLMAGVGAIGATAKESQQMSVIFILPAIVPFYVFIFFTRENPEHIINTILTMIPITAPMSVFIRLGISEIPTWELLLSISLMIAGIVGGLVLAAKVFRTFLLMYGKTPTLGEIIRSLRQA